MGDGAKEKDFPEDWIESGGGVDDVFEFWRFLFLVLD